MSGGEEMQITVNGDEIKIAKGVQTVQDLLVSFQLLNKGAIVELNQEILDKKEYETRRLANKDRIEIVHFVGGG